jgi:hypothetical protein
MTLTREHPDHLLAILQLHDANDQVVDALLPPRFAEP